MYEHRFRQISMSFVNSPKIARLTHFQFRFALHCLMYSYERWQLPFDEVSLIRTIDRKNVLKMQLGQVRATRALFLGAEVGFFVRAPFDGEDGLLIAEEFRKFESEKTGANAAASPQLALPLPNEMSVLPAPLPRNGLRLDQEKIKHESARTRPEAARPNPTHPDAVMNRSDAKGGESRFARDIESLMASPRGRRLAQFLGMPQMLEEARRSGAEWMRILRDEGAALEELLDQGERCKADMPEGSTRAKFLTARLKQRRAA